MVFQTGVATSGIDVEALAKQAEQAAAQQRAYQQQLKEWEDEQRRLYSPSRMSYVQDPYRQVAGQGPMYQWVTSPAAPPGPPPDAYQRPRPLPSFAYGGTTFGGRALVGEQGPEVVDLPPGAQVNPNPYTTGGLRRPPPVAPIPSPYYGGRATSGVYDYAAQRPYVYGGVRAPAPLLPYDPRAMLEANPYPNATPAQGATQYADPGQAALYGSTTRPGGYANQPSVPVVGQGPQGPMTEAEYWQQRWIYELQNQEADRLEQARQFNLKEEAMRNEAILNRFGQYTQGGRVATPLPPAGRVGMSVQRPTSGPGAVGTGAAALQKLAETSIGSPQGESDYATIERMVMGDPNNPQDYPASPYANILARGEDPGVNASPLDRVYLALRKRRTQLGAMPQGSVGAPYNQPAY